MNRFHWSGVALLQVAVSLSLLGIILQGNLPWDEQANFVIAKSKKIPSAFRFLRKYLTKIQFLKATSTNYYGAAFNASTVWYQCLKKKERTKLNSIHFRLLRTAKQDYKMKLSGNKLCKCATPDQWSKFPTASREIKILRDKKPAILHDTLFFINLFIQKIALKKLNKTRSKQ